MHPIRVLALAALLGIAGDATAADKPASAPLSPFGIGSCYINNRSVQDNERWVPQMAAIGLGVYRTPHTDWGAVEPAEGKWAWETLDKQMKYLDEQKFVYGAMLIGAVIVELATFYQFDADAMTSSRISVDL